MKTKIFVIGLDLDGSKTDAAAFEEDLRDLVAKHNGEASKPNRNWNKGGEIRVREAGSLATQTVDIRYQFQSLLERVASLFMFCHETIIED